MSHRGTHSLDARRFRPAIALAAFANVFLAQSALAEGLKPIEYVYANGTKIKLSGQLNVGVLRLRLGVPGLNLDVLGQVSKLKTSFFRWFCMQATQHCANAPTLTKHWQERQKSRFCTFYKLCAQAPKPHQIDLGACHTKLSTKIVLETGLGVRRAPF